jgi:phosphoribosylformylglycinamidine synthase
MWQFSQVIDGLTRACEELETPITGGNVSFYNETLGEAIYPTPVVGIVGILEDSSKAVRPDFRQAGYAVLLLRGAEAGDVTDMQAEFGSSEYAKEILGSVWGFPPALELEREAALQQCLVELAAAGLLDSAHDCSEGGLAVALAECGFLNHVGASIDLTSSDLPREFVLFGEDASRVVLSTAQENVEQIQQIALKYGVAVELLGTTAPDKLEIRVDGRMVVSAAVAELSGGWSQALERALHTDTEERLVPAVLQKS